MAMNSTSSSTFARRLSARQQRLSMLSRTREVNEDDSGSESESWATRTERRQSLARRLASPTMGTFSDTTPRPELPRRSVSSTHVRHSSSRAAPGQEPPPPYFTPGNADETLKEKYLTDPERAARIVQMWEVMAKCFDQITGSLDNLPAKPVQEPVNRPKTGIETPGLMAALPQESGMRYPCPFRKRNPARFNIRNHEYCSKAQFSMLDLRQHVVTYHKQKISSLQCRRCKVKFDSEVALTSHMMLPKDQICDLDLTEGDDPEDGIPDQTVQTLCENTTKTEWTWGRIWNLLFPSDTEVPDSNFQPVVELSEIDQAFDEKEDELKASLRQTLRLFLPEEINDDYCGFLAGQLDLVAQTHRSNVMRLCLSNAAAPTASSSSNTTMLQQQSEKKPPNGGGNEQQQQQQSFARRSGRRSRQSTLFQQQKPVIVALALKNPKRFSSTTTDPSPSPSPHHIHARVASTPLSLRDYDTASTSPTLINEEDDDDDHTDSRDSGVGMIHCAACEQEVCRCCRKGQVTLQASDREGQQHHGRIYGQQEEKKEEFVSSPQQKNLRRASADVVVKGGRSLRRQPQREVLRVRVDDEVMMGDKTLRDDVGGGSGSGSGSEDGRFSPQSFKQRVMRNSGL